MRWHLHHICINFQSCERFVQELRTVRGFKRTGAALPDLVHRELALVVAREISDLLGRLPSFFKQLASLAAIRRCKSAIAKYLKSCPAQTYMPASTSRTPQTDYVQGILRHANGWSVKIYLKPWVVVIQVSQFYSTEILPTYLGVRATKQRYGKLLGSVHVSEALWQAVIENASSIPLVLRYSYDTRNLVKQGGLETSATTDLLQIIQWHQHLTALHSSGIEDGSQKT